MANVLVNHHVNMYCPSTVYSKRQLTSRKLNYRTESRIDCLRRSDEQEATGRNGRTTSSTMPRSFVGKPPRSQLRLLFLGGDGITKVPNSVPVGMGKEDVSVGATVGLELVEVVPGVVEVFTAGPAPKPEYSPWALEDQSSTKTLEAGLQVEMSMTPMSR